MLENDESNYLPEIGEQELSDEEVLVEIKSLKDELKDEVLILGHHYQNDDIIRFADETGDSLALAKKAVDIDKPYVIFCGVHFMAETADIVAKTDRTVILPDLNAGCSMADMANIVGVEKAWNYIHEHTDSKVIPITYINCDANLKGFVGKNDGSICTSSNAKQVIEWAFERGQKLLFFPDQHLGRNTCYEMGIPREDMVVYNPNMYNGGLLPEQIKSAKVILWYGYCSVHQGFTEQQVKELKQKDSEMKVIVHPECNFDVVQAADESGSTSYIINRVNELPSGSKIAVGTEINLVNRLAQEHPDKKIVSLSPYQCLCTTMYRVRPRWLLNSLRSIKNKKPINVISVDGETKKYALDALNRMLSIS